MMYLVVGQRVRDAPQWVRAFTPGAETRRAALLLADPVASRRITTAQ
ncbi:hypothetical protein ACIA8C_12480 [Nocardia sp. NPDC051321]